MPVDIIWTALPNGRGDDGQLRLSAHVAPRLTVSGGGDTTLAAEPDFADFLVWPPADLAFEVSFGGAPPVAASVVSEPADHSLWEAVFPPSTPVRSFAVPDLTDVPLHTYPLTKVAGWLASTYAAIAAASPTDHPSIDDLQAAFGVEEVNFTGGRTAMLRWEQAMAWLQEQFDATGVVDTTAASDATKDFAQLKDYFAPADVDPEVAFQTTPEEPDPDFHQAVAYVGRHRRLQRLLGLVFDLEVAVRAVPTGTTQVQVFARWDPAGPVIERHPATVCDVSADGFLATASTPRLVDGQLALEQPSLFDVVQVDADGGAVKIMDLAGNLERIKLHQTADTSEDSAVPALRSGGIAVAELGHAVVVNAELANALVLDAAMANDPPLHAEELVRGYRVDVFDVALDLWRSVVDQVTGYHFPDLDRDEVEQSEGIVSSVVTRKPGADDLYASEDLFTWDGWSLVARRPGRILDHPGDPTEDPLMDPPGNPAGPTFRVSITGDVAPGTLPLLRYGRRYRLRVRTVDIANNAIPFTETGNDAHATQEIVYGRFEPVQSPPVLLRTPPGPGESVEQVVLRSDLVPPPSPTTAERHLVVPKVGQVFVEQHGAVDITSPTDPSLVVPDGSPATWQLLAKRDAATIAEHGTGLPVPGQPGIQHYDVDDLEVTWSPDPLSRGLRIGFLDGVHGGTSRRELLAPIGTPWPGDWSVRLVVRDGPGPVEFDGTQLIVPLAKGEVTQARLSSVIERDDVARFGLWGWLLAAGLSPAQLQDLFTVIAEGHHWMVTPFRTLTLMHAVRQPLATPEYPMPPAPSRPMGATWARLRGQLDFNRTSTGRVDFVGDWEEPVDVGPGGPTPDEASPFSRVLNAIAFSYDVEHGDDHHPTQHLYDGRHEFGDTKHRKVSYSAVATTRFLEQFEDTDTFPSAGPNSTVVLATGGLGVVAGTLRVTWKDDDATRVVDAASYELDPQTATLSFGDGVSGAVPPAGAEVTVRFNVPPVTRVTAEPPDGQGAQPVSIPSSARPPAPAVRYALPTFRWDRTEQADTAGRLSAISSVRGGGGLRIYLERPWWASGEGELLGVLVWPGATGTGDLSDEDPLKGYVSEWGLDPVYAGPNLPFRYPRLTSFPEAVRTSVSTVSLKETGDDSTLGVHVAGHAVGFDAARDLWYCDLHIEGGAAYTPMIRLALARWQPESLANAGLSPVVLADFVQTAPDRMAVVRFQPSDPRKLSISLGGPSPSATAMGAGPGVATVTLEELVNEARGELGWQAVMGPTLLNSSLAGDNGVWTGDVDLPTADRSKYRLVVEQYERLPAEPTKPSNKANPFLPVPATRLVHTDIIPLQAGLA